MLFHGDLCLSVSGRKNGEGRKNFQKIVATKLSFGMLSSRKKSQSCYFSVFRAMRGSIQGVKLGTIQGANTRVSRFGPNIEVGKSTLVCDYRCAHLVWSVGVICCYGKRLGAGVFSVFVIPSCVGVVWCRVSLRCLGEFRMVFEFDSFLGCAFPFPSLGSLRGSFLCVQILCGCNFP